MSISFFLNKGVIFALRQSDGSVPVFSEHRNMVQSPCKISSAQFFKTMFGMPPGSIALCTSNRFSNFKTPLLSIEICGIGGVFLNFPTSGLVLSVDRVKPETNCFKNIFA